MAVTTTSRLGLTQWSAGTDPFTRAQMQAGFAALEANAAMFAAGTLAARPAAGKAGRFYQVTDAAAEAPTVFYDTGSAWVEIRPNLTGYATESALTTGLAGKAASSHTHAAGDVTSGVFATARLGTGTASSTTVLHGDGAWKALVAASIAGASDTTITSPATGQVLRWNGTRWVNATLATSDVSGLDTALSGKAASSHTHTKSQITDFAHTHPIGDLPVAASGAVSSTALVRADDSRLSDARTPTAHNHDASAITSGTVALARLPVAASGTSSSTLLVRADDSRLSDARTPVAHSHAIGDLPVAASGASSSTALVRADDARLSNTRTPTAGSTFTTPVLAGTITAGTGNGDVEKRKAVVLENDTRSVTLGYTGTDLTSVTEKNGATTVKTTTLAYSGGKLTTITEVAGGTTVTTTLTYSGDTLTGTTRSVA